MPSRPDRPKVLTPETQAKIILLLRNGNYIETACQAAGINSETFYHWRRQYEAGARNAKQYTDFFVSCKAVSAEAEADALSRVRDGEQGWQGPAWYLARRHPKRWGKKREDPSEIQQVTRIEVVRVDRRIDPASQGPGEGQD